MLDRVVAACFEDVEKAHEVAGQIGVGVGDGIAHTRLRGKVDDLVEMLGGKERVKRLFLFEAHADETEIAMHCALHHRMPGQVT